MLFNNLTSRRLRGPATWLALVLLLATTGLQAAELSHLHGPLDSAEHCLLCKADTQLLPLGGTAADGAFLTAAAPAIGEPRPTLAAALDPAKARGPPAHF